MISIDDFKKISLEDKIIFDKHYEKYPPIHSDNVFTTLISWMEYSNYKYYYSKDNLLIFSQIKNQIQFRPQSGKKNKEMYDQVLKLAKMQDSESPFVLIDNSIKDWLMINYPKMEFISDRAYFDYIYLASDLAGLFGSAYSKIRNRLNKFINNYSHKVEIISEENMQDVKKFLKRWCLWKDCESDPILENEKKAILYSIANFFELKLSGIAIIINDKIEAIAVYEKMNPDTAVVHYEKGSPDYDGIYKAINQETAKILQNTVKYINRESDMDIAGLRKAKMSYRPHHMIEVYHAKKDSLF